MEWTKLIKQNHSIGNSSAFDDTSALQNNNKDGPNGHQQPSRIGDEFSGEFQLDTSSSSTTTTTTTTANNINSATAAEQKAAAVRRVSISRSGRYKSKNKQRARLPSSETPGEVSASSDVTTSGPHSVPKCADSIFGQFSPQQATVDAVKPGQSTATQFARSQSQPNEARATYNSVGNFSTSNAAELRRQNANPPPSVVPRNVAAASCEPAKMINSPCDVDDDEPAPLHIAFESTDL